MSAPADDPLAEALSWSCALLGPCEVLADHTREHPGHQSGTLRLRTPTGGAYLKVHQDAGSWESEVHAYEQWAPAFGVRAPRLLGVREQPPLAVLISELPGIVMETARLTPAQEQAAWRSAGQALSALHSLPPGTCFGPAQRAPVRQGAACVEGRTASAREFVAAELEEWAGRGLRSGWLSADEQAILRATRALIPSFAGELPLPCHRDYGPANWLVDGAGVWCGVIDFEFARWDVRVSDFTRHPDWEWIHRPDLFAALLEGYGRVLSSAEEQQMQFGHALYALSAIVWGLESAFYNFAEEGRQALRAVGNRV